MWFGSWLTKEILKGIILKIIIRMAGFFLSGKWRWPGLNLWIWTLLTLGVNVAKGLGLLLLHLKCLERTKCKEKASWVHSYIVCFNFMPLLSFLQQPDRQNIKVDHFLSALISYKITLHWSNLTATLRLPSGTENKCIELWQTFTLLSLIALSTEEKILRLVAPFSLALLSSIISL